MQELEQKLNYAFHNSALLREAMSHSSYANEHRAAHLNSNERLEFLGDSVLGFVTAEFLFRQHPDLPEGDLTRIRAALVCEQSLYEVARKLDLGRYLKLGRGEEATGGRKRDSILADAFEAVIGAIYLDGGIEAARKHILGQLPDTVNKEPLHYEIINEEGPDHNKVFTSAVRHGKDVLGTGKGKSKKEAEQAAALNALKEMNIIK